jgi:3-oxoadipate enol-lactonase
MTAAMPAPEPPRPLPPARTVHVRGRGEFFLRDSDATHSTDPGRPTVMLLHGWLASADMNWYGAYDALTAAGYRVLAIDHRGHGRGLRPLVPFRLDDCAADAAAVIRELGAGPALVVGYSMGGAIAQFVARDHLDVVSGLVLSGTAQHWQEPEVKRVWRAMGALGLAMSVAPRPALRAGLRRMGLSASEHTAWLQSEVLRHSARDIAEAGRELGRFDSRPWSAPLPVATAVVLTSRDEAVSPFKQRQLAQALGAEVFEAPISHLQITSAPDRYNPALLAALDFLRGRARVAAA